MRPIRPLAAALLIAAAAGPAAAFPIPFSADPCPSGLDCYGFKAGPVLSVAPDAPPALQAFEVGEPIYGRFDVRDEAPDAEPAPGLGAFIIPEGGFQLGGLESGAVLDVGGGIAVSVAPDRLVLASLSEPGPETPFAVDRVVFAFGFEAFPAPEDLPRTLSGPPDLFTPQGWLRVANLAGADSVVAFFDGETSAPGLSFAAPSRRVPTPGALPLLLAPVAAAAALRLARAGGLRSRRAPPAPGAPRR
jgi:hypothetical protein